MPGMTWKSSVSLVRFSSRKRRMALFSEGVPIVVGFR